MTASAAVVLHLVTALWVAGLSVSLAVVARHGRDTRRAVVGERRRQPHVAGQPAFPMPENATPTPPAGLAVHRPVRGPDDVVAGPPTVRGDTVRDWLRYYTNRDFSWNDAVAEFYRRAAGDPAIASYFVGVDLDRLQRHFAAAMVLVTNTGLTARTVQAMTLAHGSVTNEAGEPITGAVYDRVVDVLLGVLDDHGVPDQAITELCLVIDPLRAAIVVTE